MSEARLESQLRQYYRLCRMVHRPLRHIVNDRTAKAVFTGEEIELFFHERHGYWVVNADKMYTGEGVRGAAPWYSREPVRKHRVIVIE